MNDNSFSPAATHQSNPTAPSHARLTRKTLCLFRRDSSQVLEVALVANKHDRNVRVGMVPKFLQPPRHVDVRGMLRDIVHQQRTDCATVVSVNGLVSPAGQGHGCRD